jgi:hypothetical protein
MAVRKKKKVSKKATKKEAKKVEEVPENILNKQLLSEEMANMEVYFAEMNQAKAEMHTNEHFKKNKMLEKENLELQIKLVEAEIARQDNFIAQRGEKYKSIENKMITYIEGIKSRYGIKSKGMIQYDRMTGKIIE